MAKRPAREPSAPVALGASILLLVLRALWVAFVVLTPVLGAWLSSSVAAHGGGSVGLAALVGVLLFPVLPGLWEAFAEWRLRRAKSTRPRVLTRGDRVLLRTLGLNLAFLCIVLAHDPRSAFRALATRGDWMLDGAQGPTAARVRGFLFATAERLTWLYELTDDDPYGDDAERKLKDGQRPAPMPTEDTIRLEDPEDPEAPRADGSGEPADPPPRESPRAAPNVGAPGKIDRDRPWPLAATPHPLAERVPAEHEASIEALARWSVEQEVDPMQRFKLLHDWVATHVDYDVSMLSAPRITQQDAQTVFASRKGVCAGYSELMVALGKPAGLDVTYVSGHARSASDEVDGERHAWNVVQIDGRKYLVDATWNAGSVGDGRFTRRYTSDYLFTPAEVFGVQHFPGDSQWQLRERPISRGEFFRQPVLSPGFFAAGFRLVRPDRSQVTTDGALGMVIERSGEGWLMVKARTASGASTRCDVQRGESFDVACMFPGPGKYDVTFFLGTEQYGTYWSVGSLAVMNDP